MVVALSLVGPLAAVLWWARRRLVRVDVTGQSMSPSLDHGDVVLVRRTSRPRSVRPGRVVVAEGVAEGPGGGLPSGPSAGWVVKRIAAVSHDLDRGRGRDAWPSDGVPVPPPLLPPLPRGTVFLLGDNRRDSRDSRHLGPWPIDRVLGVVLCRLQRSPSA